MKSKKTTALPITTKRLRILQGKMTLRQFSELTGIGQSTLHNYLKGRDIKGKFIKKICERTGADANWLLGIKETAPLVRGRRTLNQLETTVSHIQRIVRDLEEGK